MQFHLGRLDLDPATLVGVVGTDFAEEDRRVLADSGMDLNELEVAAGETFRWEGTYQGAMAKQKPLPLTRRVRTLSTRS